MKNAWTEFKAFALGGNLVDLAIGFIIGAAFASVVESLAKNLIMDFVTAVGGAPSTEALTLTIRNGKIHYGTFLGDLLSFLIMAAVLFGLVKLLKRAGMGNFKAQGQVECPYCKEFVSVDAIKCKWCTADIEPGLVDEEEERRTISFRRKRGEQPTDTIVAEPTDTV